MFLLSHFAIDVQYMFMFMLHAFVIASFALRFCKSAEDRDHVNHTSFTARAPTLFDGRRTSTILQNALLEEQARCGAREALTVGYQPTTTLFIRLAG